ncbi:MAG: transposase [Bradyrhizobium sp.]
MPRYIRATAKSSIFFFTVVLAQRPGNLLSDEIDRLRRIYQAIQRRYPFETVAMCILPDHIHALWEMPDGDADFLYPLEPDQEWLFERSGGASATDQQNFQT